VHGREAQEAIVSRLLMREARRSVLGGVAAGFGEYLQVDPVLVRIGFVLLTFAHGIGLLLYAICWVLMPARSAATTPWPAAPAEGALGASAAPATDEPAGAQLAIGAVLVVMGALLLAHNLDWLHWPRWLRFDTLWPLLLVALGLGLMARSRGRAAA
jgi:phage shock protein PspC (stress-responsive transcriptional regulator)